MDVFYSNSLEILYSKLKSSLFEKKCAPFAKRLLVVPSGSFKSWLSLLLASDPEIGIAAGLEIVPLSQAIFILTNLLEANQGKKSAFPSSLEMSLAIENNLANALNQGFEGKNSRAFASIKEYLKDPAKQNKRMLSLSEKLGKLFLQYGLYGGKMIQELEKDASSFQSILWQTLFSKEGYGFTTPYKDLLEISIPGSIKDFPLEVHLFAPGFLSFLHMQFFKRLSKAFPVCLYQMSPCQMFWGDIQSKYESKQIQKTAEKKCTSQKQLEELESYLEDKNDLLASFGKLRREMAKQTEELFDHVLESYVLPKSALDIPAFEALCTSDLLLHDTKKPLCLLEAVQADLLLLRNPSREEKIHFPDTDHSLQVHFAPSKIREVEAVKHACLDLISKKQLKPSDILVLAPDISLYAPYIETIFQSSENSLKVKVQDASLLEKNKAAKSFLKLLSLSSSRWDAVSLLKLLSQDLFARRFSLTESDIQKIKRWIQSADVRWGFDEKHKAAALQKDHAHLLIDSDQSVLGTWQGAISLLISDLVIAKEGGEDLFDFPKKPLVDMSDIDLLEKWILQIRSLKSDLETLSYRKQTLGEWSAFLKQLYLKYFASGNKDDLADQEQLFSYLESFSQAEEKLGKLFFSFDSIKPRLEALLTSGKTCLELNFAAINFCSLLPGKILPAKAVIFMGLDLESFPGKQLSSDLDLMKKNKASDYSPSSLEFDKNLILDGLLMAKSHLLLFYSAKSGGDSVQAPSTVIMDLLAYLDKGYLVDGKAPSSALFFKHPPLGCDASLFSQSPLKSYSAKDFKRASLFSSKEEKSIGGFIEDFSINNLPDAQSTYLIDIKALASFAKNPMKLFFNKSLGIDIKAKEDKKIKTEEDFSLSKLSLYKMKKSALKTDLKSILEKKENAFLLPEGPFRQVFLTHLEKDIDQIKENMEALEASQEPIFEIFLAESFSSPQKDAKGFCLPPFEVNTSYGIVKLVGKLKNISKKGLISLDKDEKKNAAKILPEALLLAALLKKHPLGIEPNVLFLKGSKPSCKSLLFEDPESLLIKYLEFYLVSEKNPSPLIPEWIDAFIESSPESLREKMTSSLQSPFQPLYNETAKWALEASIPCTASASKHWKPVAEATFSKLYSSWYGRNKKS